MLLVAQLFKSLQLAVSLLLVTRAVMSWVVQDWYHPLPQFILQVTEPILQPMRNLFDRLGVPRMGLDLSFLATILAINYLGNMIYYMLLRMAF